MTQSLQTVQFDFPASKRILTFPATKNLKQILQKESINLYLNLPCVRFLVKFDLIAAKPWLQRRHAHAPPKERYLSHSTFVKIYSNDKFYLLPLPNTYKDGRICMDLIYGKSPEDLIHNVISEFFSSKFNFASVEALRLYGFKSSEGYGEFLKKWTQASKDDVPLNQIINLLNIK